MTEIMINTIEDDLRRILREGLVATQEEVCQTLEMMGHDINQSKASRLLRKLGAVKAKNESGDVVYRLPQEPAPPLLSDKLSAVLLDIQANETMIMVSTSPGSAQLIARVLDYHREQLNILGTIAGDDTLFVAPRSVAKIEDTIKALKSLLF